MRYKTLITLAVTAMVLLPFRAKAQNDSVDLTPEPLAIGTQAPPISLPDILGNQKDMQQYFGRSPVVLSFWSIYCDSCVDEMLSLQKLEDKYQGKDLVIVAVNEDIRVPKERIRRFIERLEKFRGKITYPLLFDEGSEIFNAYKVPSLPTLVLIDRDGRIADYFHGFDPLQENDLLSSIEALVQGENPTRAALAPEIADRSELITASGEAALCGFFDSSGWRKSFSGSESVEAEMELTRDLSRRAAARNTVVEALRMLGIKLYSNEPIAGCLDPNGIHLSRDPFDTMDPVSNLLALLSYADFFETDEEQEMLINKTYYTTRKIQVAMDNFEKELESLGYLFEPLKITFTYVNMSRLDQKAFIISLLNQSRFIGRLENPVFTPTSTSQDLEVYTSSQGFADEILGMDFGELKVFVEEVTATSLELEVWK